MLKTCAIDQGTFKYIQILAKAISGEEQLLVRGWRDCGYHADILEKFERAENEDESVKARCLGGGRITHNPECRTIHIYGYSQGFGRCDHAETQKIVEQEFPDFKVTWTNEGY